MCVLVCVCAKRELITKLNRRNTVYPERYKTEERNKKRAREELGGGGEMI